MGRFHTFVDCESMQLQLDHVIRALRPVLLCLLAAVPAVALRLAGVHPAAPVAIVVFGAGVVAASFVLAWAAEAAEVDISGGLAIALLALIAVLPEYAVDLYFAHTAGSDPAYMAYAAANMTGSNRLLLGLGWSSVVLVACSSPAVAAAGPSGRWCSTPATGASSASSPIAARGRVRHAADRPDPPGAGHRAARPSSGTTCGARRSPVHDDEPDLVGPAARIGALPKVAAAARCRRLVRWWRRRPSCAGRAVRGLAGRERAGARRRPVPAGAVAGAAGLGGAGVDRRDPVRLARQGRGRARPADLGEGQPVDPAGRQPPDRVRHRRRPRRAAAGRASGRGVPADRDPDRARRRRSC